MSSQRPRPDEVEAVVVAVAVATGVYLIKSKTMHLSSFEFAKFAWRKVAHKDTARFREELSEGQDRVRARGDGWRWMKWLSSSLRGKGGNLEGSQNCAWWEW